MFKDAEDDDGQHADHGHGIVMARAWGIELEGGRELRTTLRRAGADMKKLRAANLEVANLVAPVAKSAAPKGNTGRLTASIRAGATQRAGILRAGYKARAPYANPIHWGWPNRGIQATLFLVTASKQAEPRWTTLYVQRIQDLINTIKGK